jgi:DNA-binding NarL/FixJ family response regulator
VSTLSNALKRPGSQILLADDNRLLRTELKNILSACNSDWEIHEADNGAQTLAQAFAIKPDLVLLDLSLPDMSGRETAQKLRQISPGTKIMICSLNDNSYLAAVAKDFGAHAFFDKTSSPDELCKSVSALLAPTN